MPTDAIRSLARTLRDTSLLHNYNLESTFHNGLVSPSLSEVNFSKGVNARSRTNGKEVGQCGTFDDPDTSLNGTTMDYYELPRERFAYWCLDLLFLICHRLPAGGSDSCPGRNRAADSLFPAESADDRKRVAVLTLPLLMSRCSPVLRLYLADSTVRGKVPFRRCERFPEKGLRTLSDIMLALL